MTSVIFSGDPVAPQSLTRAATSQDYFPEWIISGSVLTDTAAFGRTYDQRQWAHAFGVSFGAARTGVTGAITLYKWYFGTGSARPHRRRHLGGRPGPLLRRPSRGSAPT